MKDWLIDGVVLGVLAGILSAAFLDWWAEREERAREAERQRLDRIMAANAPRAAGDWQSLG